MSRLNDPLADNDKLLSVLRLLNRFAVRCLAVLMTVVILFGVADVAYIVYQRLMTPPLFVVTIDDIVGVFGAFIAVLIAIEIFVNITVYLTENVIHVQIVMATALMAIARKVIILDFKELAPEYVMGTAAVVLAMSIGYWLVVKKDSQTSRQEHGLFTMVEHRLAPSEQAAAEASDPAPAPPSGTAPSSPSGH
ncbi:MAG: phosphate-starvation-inducible PsiE family protein [Patescibacteria group bacterium]|nr:phosphate-starvation-inducible PsiE family protein [Patescibacteria group bacterium]